MMYYIGHSDQEYVSNGAKEVELQGMNGSIENIAKFKRMERVQTQSRSSTAHSPDFGPNPKYKRSLSNGYPPYSRNGIHVNAKVANIGTRSSLTGISEESNTDITLTPAPSNDNLIANGNGDVNHKNGKHLNGKHINGQNGKHKNGNKNGVVSGHKMSNLDLSREEIPDESPLTHPHESEIVIVTKKMTDSQEIIYEDNNNNGQIINGHNA